MEVAIVILTGIIIWIFIWHKKSHVPVVKYFPGDYRKMLNLNVLFYQQLSEDEKKQFEDRMMHFLNTTKITGIDTEVEDLDRVLVSASAIIPVFAFPDWEYLNLNEVLLYPAGFNDRFETIGGSIQGMVGTGYMEGKMIISKPALRLGFKNETDKINVGIHEFAHLIDKADGVVDGIPSLLLEKQYAIPWIELMMKKMEEIHDLKSDINPYGGVDKSEFFPVISEYFFERPNLLKAKHPDLYNYLQEIFTVDLSKKYKTNKHNRELNRNDPCSCGSGEKYKHCCLVN